jgi:Ca2+/H+ antiporter
MKMEQKTGAEHKQLSEGSDEVVESMENPTLMITKAVLLLVLGTAMAAVFADPLVDAVDNFSLATSIPSFFISFIFMPLATNSSEAVSAIIFASRKKQRTSSLTFSEVSNLSILFFSLFW